MKIKFMGSEAKRWYLDEAPPRLNEGEAVKAINGDKYNKENVPVCYRSKEGYYVIGPNILIPYGIIAKKKEGKIKEKDFGEYGKVTYETKYTSAVEKFYTLTGYEIVKVEENGEEVLIPFQEKKGRGRPSVPMNELKAMNIIRATKKGVISDNMAEAIAFLKANKQEKFLNKYEKFFLKS